MHMCVYMCVSPWKPEKGLISLFASQFSLDVEKHFQMILNLQKIQQKSTKVLSGFSDFILPQLPFLCMRLAQKCLFHGDVETLVIWLATGGFTEGFVFSIWPRFTYWFSGSMLAIAGKGVARLAVCMEAL